MTSYKVKINFGSIQPLLQEMEEMTETFNNSNFHLFTDSDVLYFASGSQTADYNFLIDKIDHDEKIVWLLAV